MSQLLVGGARASREGRLESTRRVDSDSVADRLSTSRVSGSILDQVLQDRVQYCKKLSSLQLSTFVADFFLDKVLTRVHSPTYL